MYRILTIKANCSSGAMCNLSRFFIQPATLQGILIFVNLLFPIQLSLQGKLIFRFDDAVWLPVN